MDKESLNDGSQYIKDGKWRLIFYRRMHSPRAKRGGPRSVWHWQPAGYFKIPVEEINSLFKFTRWCLQNLPKINNEVYRISTQGRGFVPVGRILITPNGLSFLDKRCILYRWLTNGRQQEER